MYEYWNKHFEPTCFPDARKPEQTLRTYLLGTTQCLILKSVLETSNDFFFFVLSCYVRVWESHQFQGILKVFFAAIHPLIIISSKIHHPCPQPIKVALLFHSSTSGLLLCKDVCVPNMMLVETPTPLTSILFSIKK